MVVNVCIPARCRWRFVAAIAAHLPDALLLLDKLKTVLELENRLAGFPWWLNAILRRTLLKVSDYACHSWESVTDETGSGVCCILVCRSRC